MKLVIIAGSIYREVSEVSRAIKQTSEICDNCPWYSNEANPPNRLLLFL